MEHIEKSIENYLSKDTDYAFLITGTWGIGKTHFLKEQIHRISAEKNQKFALISLYGVI
jgi:predicted AAA+ superfamily ATPase